MSIDPDAFRQMFAASAPQASPESEEPPMREEFIEPPIRFEEPPLSPQEIDAAAADELLKIAAADEQALQKLRKEQRSKDTFVITCPKGCQIRVKESHRGRSGKCPRCQSEFIVPKKPSPKPSPKPPE